MDGGALHIDNVQALATLERCIFSNNSVVDQQGGAVGGSSVCGLRIVDTLFRGNWASDSGGAIAMPLPVDTESCLLDEELADFVGSDPSSVWTASTLV